MILVMLIKLNEISVTEDFSVTAAKANWLQSAGLILSTIWLIFSSKRLKP